MARPTDGDLGFSFVSRTSGEVSIYRGGRVVTVLRGRAALDFGMRVAGLHRRRSSRRWRGSPATTSEAMSAKGASAN